MYYKTLGFLVWRAGRWWLRRRYGAAPKRLGAGLLAAAFAGAGVLAQRTRGRAD